MIPTVTAADVQAMGDAVPPFLCGVGGCAFTPHDAETPHTWQASELF